jgi:hypothetical protein
VGGGVASIASCPTPNANGPSTCRIWIPTLSSLGTPWLNFSNSTGETTTGLNYPVKNQGNCGSCWAFATTAALESYFLKQENQPNHNEDFAEQVLVSCSGAGSCGGGYPSTASTYIRDTGLPPEMDYFYTATDGSCTSAVGLAASRLPHRFLVLCQRLALGGCHQKCPGHLWSSGNHVPGLLGLYQLQVGHLFVCHRKLSGDPLL